MAKKMAVANLISSAKCKTKKPKLRTFHVINDFDANDRFEVKAENAQDAAHLALEKLGWWIAKE